MRKILFLLPLLAALPVSAEPLNYNVVSFSETASATVANDTMKITFAVEESGKDRRDVSNRVTRRLNALNARIFADKTFKGAMGNRSAHAVYDDKGRITGWKDTAYISVESKNFQALSQLAASSQNDAAVRGMQFSVSPEKRSATTDELSRQALKNFRTRAEFISNTLGFRGYKIVNIQIDNNFTAYRSAAPVAMRSAKAAGEESDAAVQIDTSNPGTEEIMQTVSGSIQM